MLDAERVEADELGGRELRVRARGNVLLLRADADCEHDSFPLYVEVAELCLAAAGVRAAVSARVAAAGADHAAAALGALDCVLPRIEQSGLARWGCLERTRLLRFRGTAAVVALR